MRNELAKYRLENAKEKLISAKLLYENKQYKDSISRSYYAMFSAAKALLAVKEVNSSKHSGVISLFNQHFVKTSIVGKNMGRILAEAKEMREDSDYEDFVVISDEEVENQIKDAEIFIGEVEEVLEGVDEED
ncbi:HEPN domain-containing protein [bacterium]|nr:HEPN domain-containing protein [bacterium]MBU0900040.1 HEPN domain-containing protein [bacterium]MBU1152383.1 HEPN domain-containing protein [bacterium]MBU1782548.1 HEPN domain-containing protein [bacterium]MBU2599096.1 HEPN domain-containing protein [bacterium]